MTLHIGRVRHRILALLLSLVPAALGAQTGSLVGYLVSRESREPLAFGIVDIEGLDRSTFADDSGRFTFGGLKPGQHQLSVRRLGFMPRSVSFVVRDGVADTLRVELTRVVMRLSAVDVKAHPPCLKPGAPSRERDSTLASIFDQIRLNAEQYKLLVDKYPHSYDAMVSHSRKRRDGVVRPDRSYVRRFHSSPRSTYRPGEVIVRNIDGFDFEVPSIVAVADPSFVKAHCWHYGGTEFVGDEPVVRVDVVAFSGIRGTDVDGSFFLNSGTFQIRRSVVRLSSRAPQLPNVIDFSVTTDFNEVLPSIPVASLVHAVRTYDRTMPSFTEAYEEQRTTRFTWKGRKPGDARMPQ
jgi:hypothetical protein